MHDIRCLVAFFLPLKLIGMCTTSQKYASEVRPWYLDLNMSSHSGSRLRSLQSLFLPTWKSLMGLCAADVGNTPWNRIDSTASGSLWWWQSPRDTYVYADRQTFRQTVPTWHDELNEGMNGRHAKSLRAVKSPFDGFNSTLGILKPFSKWLKLLKKRKKKHRELLGWPMLSLCIWNRFSHHQLFSHLAAGMTMIRPTPVFWHLSKIIPVTLLVLTLNTMSTWFKQTDNMT